MREVQPGRVHLITGGYPPGALAAHDMGLRPHQAP